MFTEIKYNLTANERGLLQNLLVDAGYTLRMNEGDLNKAMEGAIYKQDGHNPGSLSSSPTHILGYLSKDPFTEIYFASILESPDPELEEDCSRVKKILLGEATF